MNTSIVIALVTVALLFVCVFAGVHISFTLMSLSFVGLFLVTSNLSTALSVLSTTAFNAIRTYTYCVIPLFMLMGTIMAVSGSAGDLFKWAHKMLEKVPGGLAAATVIGNAVFAAVTGVSVASATVFSQVAIPEMRKYKYDSNFATGIVCGSSNLGMIIPPSLFFIVYGTVAQVSIGQLFVGGVLPGILMATIFIIYTSIYGTRHPAAIGLDPVTRKPLYEDPDPKGKLESTLRALPIVLLIIVVLGGIWGGYVTPTEASAIGCLGAFIIALCKRSLTWKSTGSILTGYQQGQRRHPHAVGLRPDVQPPAERQRRCEVGLYQHPQCQSPQLGPHRRVPAAGPGSGLRHRRQLHHPADNPHYPAGDPGHGLQPSLVGRYPGDGRLHWPDHAALRHHRVRLQRCSGRHCGCGYHL